jgi:hypothetical protein
MGMQPGMHGASHTAMQLGTSLSKPFGLSKVKNSVHLAAVICDGDAVFPTKNCDEQGSMNPGFTNADK